MPAPPIIPPAGVSPISGEIGVPFDDPKLPPVIRAMLIDPITGERLSLTKDAPPVHAAILRQFRTRRASGAAVLNDGQDLQSVRKNDTHAQTSIRFEIERIFEPFVAAGYVRVDSIVPTGGESALWFGGAIVHYTDLTTGDKRSINAKK